MSNSSDPEAALWQKLDRIEQSPPINVAALDFDLQNPNALREEMGTVFNYFARVESEVMRDGEVLAALLPNMEAPHARFIYDAWIPQELPHGEIFDTLQRQLGLEPAPVESGADAKMKAAGLVARLSASAHRVFEMVYLGRGAMHETSVMPAYRMMSDRLRALGEVALPEIIERGIVPQEGGHIGYYRLAASQKKAQLSPRERLVARLLSVAGYTPVGANTSEHQRQFGAVADTLSGGDETEITNFMVPVDRIADTLLALGGDELEQLSRSPRDRMLLTIGARKGWVDAPDFALRSVRNCIMAAREAAERAA